MDNNHNIMDNNHNITINYHNIIINYHNIIINNHNNNIILNIINKKWVLLLMHQFLTVLLPILLKIQCIINNFHKNLIKNKNGFRILNLSKVGYHKDKINILKNMILIKPKLLNLNHNNHKFQLNLILISMIKKYKKNVYKKTLIYLICCVNMMKHLFQN